MIEYTSYKSALKEIGVSYIGCASVSSKLELSAKAGTLTYGIYMAPANMAIKSKTVCPNSEHCRVYCLNGSGRNKVALMAGKNRVQEARILKTKSFFNKRQLLSEAIAHEIRRWAAVAERKGMSFAVRLNCTSDINPERFVLANGNNLLQEFSDIQFYDYTKVPSRLALMNKYGNYDLTFSFDGHNHDACQRFLQNKGRVAVVFRNHKQLPSKFMGYNVVDGNKYDMRFLDPKGVVIGLSFHLTAANYKKVDGKLTFVEPNSDFVITDDNKMCVW